MWFVWDSDLLQVCAVMWFVWDSDFSLHKWKYITYRWVSLSGGLIEQWLHWKSKLSCLTISCHMQQDCMSNIYTGIYTINSNNKTESTMCLCMQCVSRPKLHRYTWLNEQTGERVWYVALFSPGFFCCVYQTKHSFTPTQEGQHLNSNLACMRSESPYCSRSIWPLHWLLKNSAAMRRCAEENTCTMYMYCIRYRDVDVWGRDSVNCRFPPNSRQNIFIAHKSQDEMGIQGLMKLIADYAPSAMKDNDIKSYFGESRELSFPRPYSTIYARTLPLVGLWHRPGDYYLLSITLYQWMEGLTLIGTNWLRWWYGADSVRNRRGLGKVGVVG